MNKIAIILPYKENYNKKIAGAVSLWVKYYLAYSNTSNFSVVFGNLENNLKPYTNNFINIKIGTRFNTNYNYINAIKKKILKNSVYSTIEIHNRPQYLKTFILSKNLIKIIVTIITVEISCFDPTTRIMKRKILKNVFIFIYCFSSKN